jgi:hypothetical protein
VNPRVLCVMLANGRQEMVNRAVRSFHSQAYKNKELLVLNSGPTFLYVSTIPAGVHLSLLNQDDRQRPIGELRNIANATATHIKADIICHWDSDDWSHPERVSEQVAFLQETGAHAVGYSEMLFWDSRPGAFCGAWLYTSPNPDTCLGTSLCYWRKTWESVPFRNVSEGEDHQWSLDLSSHRCAMRACSAIPRMIAHIHGGNSFGAIKPGATEWQRFSGMDQYCREAMKL